MAGPQLWGRAVPSERAHEPLGEEVAPCTCYWRGVDPEDGHISADVKNFGAPQEFLVLNGLFPRHPDHRLLKVGGGDFLSLEEEQDINGETPAPSTGCFSSPWLRGTSALPESSCTSPASAPAAHRMHMQYPDSPHHPALLSLSSSPQTLFLPSPHYLEEPSGAPLVI